MMSKQVNRIPSALKHGCYSGLTVLPTEDRVAFDKLHRDLVDEYRPIGRSEEITVSNYARLVWRRENLATYLLAESAKSRYSSIYYKLHPPAKWEMPLLLGDKETRSPEELRVLRKEAEEQAQRELGPALELVEMGDVATPEHLEKELALLERLDGIIAKCLKQLLLIRGVKSISSSAPVESSPSRIKRIA